eukprot:CAMPEP_0203807898 /NCGR_PEP_ID=MMETSP0115-20131106/1312_1 /ASSEMBLY_ACC=CAM_ASM_000227 /TAXON_ID=33651 /ORGANISM="Bicosoecid sp, Strain ms1" /LENGTH=307 /DNA_ID=CAMNT_0050716583 /DNA_START=399 /DNA_END=1318 /DNA_ORIENTATION=+
MGNGNTRGRQRESGGYPAGAGGDGRGGYSALGRDGAPGGPSRGGDGGGGPAAARPGADPRGASSRGAYPGAGAGGAGGAVHVVCPQCHAVLVPPARVFRCPCGQTMTYNVPRPRGDGFMGHTGLRFVALGGGPSESSLHAMAVEERIHSLMRSLPPDHPQALMLAQLLRRLPRNADGTISQRALSQLADELDSINGTPAAVVDALPLHNYKPPKSAEEMEEEQQTCMVCLGEYEENEVIRTLPCLHIFHQPCIDKWLSANKTCPLCKHDVTDDDTSLDSAIRESEASARREEAGRRAAAAGGSGGGG